MEGLKKYERGHLVQNPPCLEFQNCWRVWQINMLHLNNTHHPPTTKILNLIMIWCSDLLLPMGLLEKAVTQSIYICFQLDFAEVYRTTRMSHVQAGMNIVDKDSKYPITKEILDYEPTIDFKNVSGVHCKLAYEL